MTTEDIGALAPSSLSVDKRVLLHLGRFDAFAEAWDVPAEVSQDGIGRTLGLLTNNVSRALSSLKNEGLIVEKLAHVKGAQRRKNAYFLSEAGRVQVDALTSAMERTSITFIDIGGERKTGTIGDMVKALRASGDADATVANVVEATRKMDSLDLRRISRTGKGIAAGALVRHISKAPVVKGFKGRDSELAEIAGFLKGERPNILVIQGLPGVGKTALGSRCLEVHGGSVHALWYQFTEWGDSKGLVKSLMEFGNAMSGPGKDAAPLFSSDLVHETLMSLEGMLTGKKAVIVLDDLQKAADDHLTVLEILKDSSRRLPGLKLIILTRVMPTFYSWKEVASDGIVMEMRLGGVDRETARQILGKEGMDDAAFEAVYNATGGIPLFLEFVANVANVNALGDIGHFLEQELISALGPGELRVLESLALFRVPVTASGALSGPAPGDFKDLEGLVSRGIVMEVPVERYDIHDLVRQRTVARLSQERTIALHSACADHHLRRIAHRDEPSSTAMMMGPSLSLMEQDPTEAVYHLQEAGRWREAAEISIAELTALLASGSGEARRLVRRFDRRQFKGKDMPDGERLWAEVLLLKADLAAQEGRMDDAVSLYKECLGLKKRLGEPSEELALIGSVLADAQMTAKRWDDTLRMRTENLEMCEGMGDKRGTARAHIGMGLLHKERMEWDKARTSYRNALGILVALKDLQGQAVVLNNIANLEDAAGRSKEALSTVRKAIKVSVESGNRTTEGMARLTAAMVYRHMSDIGEETRELAKASDALRETGEWRETIETLILLGKARARGGDEAAARKELFKALDILQTEAGRRRGLFGRRQTVVGAEDGEMTDQRTRSSLYSDIASTYRKERAWADAARYGLMAADMMRQVIDGAEGEEADDLSLDLARLMLDVALDLESAGDLDKALEVLAIPRDVFARLGIHKGLMAVFMTKARVLSAQGFEKKARETLAKAMDTAKTANDDRAVKMVERLMSRRDSKKGGGG